MNAHTARWHLTPLNAPTVDESLHEARQSNVNSTIAAVRNRDASPAEPWGRRSPSPSTCGEPEGASRVDRSLASSVRLWRQLRRLRYLGVVGDQVPDGTTDVHAIANFVRPRASTVLLWVYAILLVPMYVALLWSYLSEQQSVYEAALAQAERVTSDATAAAARQAAAHLNEGWAILFVGLWILLFVFLGSAWAWNSLSLAIGGRDRNTGIATRGLLHSLRRGHEHSVIARRQLFQSLRKWDRSARRAGVRADVVEAVSAAVTDPATRRKGGDEYARTLLVTFAQQYDSGELIDPDQVTQQRSQLVSNGRDVLTVLAGLAPLVGIVVTTWAEWRP